MQFYFSGTVGDSFIAFCKLYKYAKTNPCSIQRLCRIAGSDTAIEKICSVFPNIEYVQPYIHFDSIDEMRNFAEQKIGQYINIFYDGNGRGNEPDDPDFLSFTSFPIVPLPIVKPFESKFTIGIQLNSGSRQENRKLLSIDWVLNVCNQLSFEEISILLFGNGDSYESEELKQLEYANKNVINLFGQTTIIEWMAYIASLDYLISPEGFSAFWGLSQKVPSILFYTEVEAILRMPTEWRNLATCIKLLPSTDVKVGSHDPRGGKFSPMNPGHIASIILTKILPAYS